MSAYLRKYATLTATGTNVGVPMIKAGLQDFATGSDWTPAAGDVKVSIDGGAQANIGTLPTYTNGQWVFALTALETTGKSIRVAIVDSATKAVEDQFFTVETFGHASAMFAIDYSSTSFGLTLAKTTNITGLNDIAATAIVTGGAITTSGGAVSTVTTTGTATTLTNLPAIPANWLTASGIAANAITAAKVATDAIGAAQLAADAVTEIQSGLSTYAGGDTSGTTTLLSRVSSLRAGYLDNLSAGAVAQAATALSTAVWTGTKAGYLDAAISGVSTGGVSAATIATAVWQDLLSGSDFGTVGSAGKLLKDNITGSLALASQIPANFTTATFASPGVFATAALANAPGGGGGSDTSGTTTLLARLSALRAGYLDNLSAGAVAQAATALSTATWTNTKAGYIDAAISGVSTGGVSAGAIAGAVWDEPRSGHVASGTFGSGANLNLDQIGLAPRALDSVADSAMTVGDAMVASIAGAAGKESIVGTAYTVKTPSTGTVVRTFTLDSGTTPTSRS